MTDVKEGALETTGDDDAVDDEPAVDVENFGRSGEPDKRAALGSPFVDPVAAGILLAVLVGAVVWLGPNSLVVIAGIVVMIFFHELGHYVMARRADMMVTEFFIGFGPRIASFRRGDVEYGLKAIPAGAYVKIIGMANIEKVPRRVRTTDVPPEELPSAVRRRGRRFGAMHFAMALVLLFVAFAFVGSQYAGVVDDDGVGGGQTVARFGGLGRGHPLRRPGRGHRRGQGVDLRGDGSRGEAPSQRNGLGRHTPWRHRSNGQRDPQFPGEHRGDGRRGHQPHHRRRRRGPCRGVTVRSTWRGRIRGGRPGRRGQWDARRWVVRPRGHRRRDLRGRSRDHRRARGGFRDRVHRNGRPGDRRGHVVGPGISRGRSRVSG